MKQTLKSYLFLIVFAGAIIALDQWTKSLVRVNIPSGGYWSPWEWLTPYARIVHWHNTGMAFGMFQGHGWILAAINIAISLTIFILFPRVPETDWPLRMAMAFQFSGGLGNLIDRLTIGYVIDFISVGSFAVFNVADSCIVLGAATLILGIWLQERKAKKEAAASQYNSTGQD